MSLSHFQALVQQLGARLGAPDMHADDSGYIALTIDELDVHFQYEPDDDQVVLFARLPVVDLDRAAEIYGLLLSANLFWQGTRGATFSIDFHTGQVFLADRRGVDGLIEQELEDWLEGFVNTALHWQQRLEAANEGGPLFPDTADGGDNGGGTGGGSGGGGFGGGGTGGGFGGGFPGIRV